MKIFHCFIAGLVFLSCTRAGLSEEKATGRSVVKESSSQAADPSIEQVENKAAAPFYAKKDSIPLHTFQRGETLWNLCRDYYGNRHYSAVVAIYNEIENVQTIENGTRIQVPALEDLLADPKLGLTQVIHDEMSKILRTRALFMKHSQALADLRKNVEGRTPIELPENVRADLQRSVALLDEAVASLENLDADSLVAPAKTIGQLRSLSSNLNDLSLGHHDGVYKYDLDMVHQRLVHAIMNSIYWAKRGYT